jgi:predicted dithiol-disulfide oxidoreductase (DUF899 family)
MSGHPTATREQWLAARLDLLRAEKELTRHSDEVARRRRELPWVPVEKEYRFQTEDGDASLADLFGGRSQLLVYHFMFGPDYTAGCPSCSAIADGFDASVAHLENHHVAFSAVSRAPVDKLTAYKRRMGWSFPWASSRATATSTTHPGLLPAPAGDLVAVAGQLLSARSRSRRAASHCSRVAVGGRLIAGLGCPGAARPSPAAS